MESTAVKYDVLKEGLTSGFKKRCLYEVKASKAKGGERGAALTSEEKRDCYRDAADALKKRFERYKIENSQRRI